MTLLIETFVLGPLENNTYLLVDDATRLAAVVDPAFGSQALKHAIHQRELSLQAIWITHAHFDHIAGVSDILSGCMQPVQIGLHPDDLPNWENKGLAGSFGIPLPELPEPSLSFYDGQILLLGESQLTVRHTPGHSPGHVILVSSADHIALVGDLIFRMGVGRTDLAGGDGPQLLHSIRKSIFTLPPETRLLNGHGPETTAGYEAKHNPFF